MEPDGAGAANVLGARLQLLEADRRCDEQVFQKQVVWTCLMNPQNENQKSRIAVVAVHGVGDQKPGASVRAVGNLLLNLDQNREPVYTAFKESGIRIHSRSVNH